MRWANFKRARAVSPGKHGDADWRVTFRGVAPKHSEVVFMVGMLLLAEDRYPLHGRHMLWRQLEKLLLAETPEQVIAIADVCEQSVVERRAA